MAPVRLIALSFAAIILIGTLLLTLPVSARSGEFTHPFDALFTATSATCVTGLIVFDTFTHWSEFGQGVILLLIQLGGLGLVTFTTFFTLAVRKRLGFRDLQIAGEAAGTGIQSLPALFRLIVRFTFTLEAAGAVLLCIRFVPEMGLEGLWVSVFLAVSAYCNAGFDLLGENAPFSSLTHYASDPLVLTVISLLIILGGLGFIVMSDLLHWRHTKRLLLHSRIVLISTAGLLVLGTIAFLVMEYQNPATLGPMSVPEKIGNAAFQSVTARTAGFNSIDLAGMHEQSKLIMCLLMFIGAAPVSTGGGIKVTTFVVVVMTVWSVVRGRQDTVILGRRVDKKVVYKSLTILCLALVVVATTFLVILFVEPDGSVDSADALIEAFSAFGTVGVSCGLTPSLSWVSQLVLIFTMFIGRVGPVSLAIAITARNEGHHAGEILPEGKVMVG